MLTVSTEKVLSSARPPEVVLREKEAEFFVFVFCVIIQMQYQSKWSHFAMQY